MRGIGEHIPPAEHQDEPADNTSRYVEAQIVTWRETGLLIHPETAREIAAAYHTPADGDTFSAFSHVGLITDGLVEAIDEELAALRCTVHDPAVDSRYEMEVDALEALKAYVEASPSRMRGIGLHLPPDQYQDAPPDLSPTQVGDQVAVWEETGLEIHPEVARQIAARFQHPGDSGVLLALFASVGEIADGLAAQIGEALDDVDNDGEMVALAALEAYVKACRPDQR